MVRYLLMVIVHVKHLKRHSEVKRRAPVYVRALRHVSGVQQKCRGLTIVRLPGRPEREAEEVLHEHYRAKVIRLSIKDIIQLR